MPITTEVLLDTNILLRTQFDKAADLTNATRALVQLRASGARLATAIQNLAEFANVSTRPERENGHGISIVEALARIDFFEQSFDILPESVLSLKIWKKLMSDHQVSGKQVHDARLAAVMMAHGIERILTFNTKHFDRFPGVQAIHPVDVLEHT